LFFEKYRSQVGNWFVLKIRLCSSAIDQGKVDNCWAQLQGIAGLSQYHHLLLLDAQSI